MSQVTWKQTFVPKDRVAEFLTRWNFQPGKFHLVPSGPFANTVTIVYVDNEFPTPRDEELITAEMAGALKARDVLNHDMGVDSRMTGSSLLARYEEINK